MLLTEPPGNLTLVENEIAEIFRGLRMAPGSVCRIAAKYLRNWGIEVGDDNRAEIRRRATDSFMEDWEGDSAQLHLAIENATERAGLSAGNKAMNMVLANTAVPIIGGLLEYHPEGINIVDMGAGTGDTTVALLDVMALKSETAPFASKCFFHLVEPSYRKTGELGKRLENHQLRPEYGMSVLTLDRYMEQAREGRFHMAVSNAVLHHMTTPDYLKALNRLLTDDGVLVVGDWYTTIWSRPDYLVPVLRALGAAACTVSRFEKYFHIKKEPRETLTPAQRKANEYMVDYVRCLAAELATVSDGSGQYLFEAHQSLDGHYADVRKAGFELDLSELRQKHMAFARCASNEMRLYPDTDLACVWSAAKLQKSRALVPRK